MDRYNEKCNDGHLSNIVCSPQDGRICILYLWICSGTIKVCICGVCKYLIILCCILVMNMNLFQRQNTKKKKKEKTKKKRAKKSSHVWACSVVVAILWYWGIIFKFAINLMVYWTLGDINEIVSLYPHYYNIRIRMPGARFFYLRSPPRYFLHLALFGFYSMADTSRHYAILFIFHRILSSLPRLNSLLCIFHYDSNVAWTIFSFWPFFFVCWTKEFHVRVAQDRLSWLSNLCAKYLWYKLAFWAE